MAKRCQKCYHTNDDNLSFCSNCGEPLDAELRLIMDLDKMSKENSAQSASRRQRDDDDDDFEYTYSEDQPDKKSALPWVILILAAAAIVLWLVLK